LTGPHEPPTLEGRALVSLGQQLQAAKDRIATLEAQAAMLRAWMAEYPHDKYTGTWWLAELDRAARDAARDAARAAAWDAARAAAWDAQRVKFKAMVDAAFAGVGVSA
jgi:transposase